MTGQMQFNSHVDRLLAVTVGLVNSLTLGLDGGRRVLAPTGAALVRAVVEAVRGAAYNPSPTRAQAEALLPFVEQARAVFEAADRRDTARAAGLVNALLVDSEARAALDEFDGEYHLHFHGPDTTFARGWAAGIASALAMALGGNIYRRLGVCEAPACDRVYVDASKNSHKRFCSTRCQSRVKAAAHRARR